MARAEGGRRGEGGRMAAGEPWASGVSREGNRCLGWKKKMGREGPHLGGFISSAIYSKVDLNFNAWL